MARSSCSYSSYSSSTAFCFGAHLAERRLAALVVALVLLALLVLSLPFFGAPPCSRRLSSTVEAAPTCCSASVRSGRSGRPPTTSRCCSAGMPSRAAIA